jgi:hypothetical protein
VEGTLDFLQRTWFGPVLVFGVIPALLAGVVLGPQIWQTLTAKIDLPVRLDSIAFPLVLIWIVAVLVAWVALWVSGWKPHSSVRYRPFRLAAGVILVTALLVGGMIPGYALRESGCGKGRDALLSELVPLGQAHATYSEDDIKDNCHGQYATSAAAEEIFAHHGAQLTSRGWTVTQSGATSLQPYLTARRGDLVVSISVNFFEGDNLVQILASQAV